MMDKERLELLAVAQALYKYIGTIVGTRDPDNLRGEADEYFKNLYLETGAKSFEVNVNGEKVGSYSVTKKDPQIRRSLTWDDDEQVIAWMIENDMVEVDEGAIMRHFLATGELPPTCEISEWETSPDIITTLRIDVDAVKDALKGELPNVVAGLLGGAE